MANKDESKVIKAGELYQYDAFISYRHIAPDSLVAKELHKQLESYKMPKNIDACLKNGHRKIERVFRDEEELPIASSLEESIVKALENSEWLIVICSPRLMESDWCRLEIKTFIELHGKDHILAVLVEGEPEDAFPPELVDEKITVIDEFGNPVTVTKRVEPLAADVRGKDTREIIKNVSSIKMRLIASMFNLNYDDLKQRHREKAMKRRLGIMGIATGVALLIGAISFVMMLRINSQKNQIAAQNEEIVAQAAEIEAQNQSLLVDQAKSEAALSLSYLEDGDRERALSTAYNALTELNGNTMPYTAEAEFALNSALYTYSDEGGYMPYGIYEMPGRVTYIAVSPDGSYVLSVDSAKNLYIWNAMTMELLDTISDVSIYDDGEHAFTFIDNERIVVVRNSKITNDNTTGTAYIYNCANKLYQKVNNPITDEVSISSDVLVRKSFDGTTLAIFSWIGHYVNVYDVATMELICSYELSESSIYQVDVIGEVVEDNGEDVGEDANSDDITYPDVDVPSVEAEMDGGVFSIDSFNLSDGFTIISNKSTNDKHYLKVFDNRSGELVLNICTEDKVVNDAKVINGVLYFVTYNDDNLSDINTTLCAVALNSKTLVCKRECNYFVNRMYVYEIDGRTFIMALSYRQIHIYDNLTMELRGEFDFGSNIVRAYLYESTIRVVTEDNISCFIPLEDDGSYENSYGAPLTGIASVGFGCMDFNFSREGIIYAANNNSNAIIMFRRVACPGIAPYVSNGNAVGRDILSLGVTFEEPQSELLYYQSGNVVDETYSELFEAKFSAFGVYDPSSVDSIIVTPDDSYLIVNRTNMHFEIYNSEGLIQSYYYEGKTIGSLLGVDDEGYIYISTSIGCDGLRISPNGEIVAEIDMLAAIDFENHNFIRYINQQYMTQPIYSIEELISMAESSF